MPALALTQLPPELRALLDQAWPGCPEAQCRALLAPWAHALFHVVWPDGLWPWQPARRWWRPAEGRAWRQAFGHLLAARRGNLLESGGPLLFSPEQPFFDTPWTQATQLLRSPEPEVFSDAEFWAITMQLCDGNQDLATAHTRGWARVMRAQGCSTRGSRRRDNFWNDELRRLRLQATGTFS
ncbi:hypothetical protein [Aquabacterium sp. OR-4]|uniref:hypothetical protein n=1 Tax=Aquabacterium sp. OR-4 TaxID=2978127 RepID=UPI0028C7DBA8|nr:hypothetical protein [Aquabacterium sp. OR-4]MDT7837984.1 hypothetical protein [Aquabacterium sp. OR-4]